VFSKKIFTNRSKVFPLTELVGLKVLAVALAASTEAAFVAVYWVCALVLAMATATAARMEGKCIMNLTRWEIRGKLQTEGKEENKKRKLLINLRDSHLQVIPVLSA